MRRLRRSLAWVRCDQDWAKFFLLFDWDTIVVQGRRRLIYFLGAWEWKALSAFACVLTGMGSDLVQWKLNDIQKQRLYSLFALKCISRESKTAKCSCFIYGRLRVQPPHAAYLWFGCLAFIFHIKDNALILNCSNPRIMTGRRLHHLEHVAELEYNNVKPLIAHWVYPTTTTRRIPRSPCPSDTLNSNSSSEYIGLYRPRSGYSVSIN